MVETLFCLMGPTASGKTDLAAELSQHFPFEIISVDSAMIYRGMDIGTAKPSFEFLKRYPHHLIDILDPPERYCAADFCSDIAKLSKGIFSKNKIPLLTGGTMMYFRALQQGLSELPTADEALREKLLNDAKNKGWPAMHALLKSIDAESAARVHQHDSQRILRALEIYYLLGKPWSKVLQSDKEKPAYRFVNLLLMPKERLWLHNRIAERFRLMLEQGFLDEVQQLQDKWQLDASFPSMRSVGYRQALEYLAGGSDYESFALKAVAATRQLAKRQLTWLRHWPDGHIFDAENPKLLSEMMVIIRKILDNSATNRP